jgi:hypothetical protein
MPRPYQPSLLRLLHGATALLVPLAWLTGLLVYSAYDGRFGRLPFTLPGEWIDIHGIVGVLLWPVALAVSLHVGWVLQRGGWPLARSMASVQMRPGDLPGNWWHHIRRSFKVNHSSQG